jgi:hypothetical protein
MEERISRHHRKLHVLPQLEEFFARASGISFAESTHLIYPEPAMGPDVA